MSVFLLFMLALLVPATGPVGAQEEEQILYLTERPFDDPSDRWNFTSITPDENESGRDRGAEQENFPTFSANWVWSLPRAPENWSVEEGDRWEFVLFIEGLDEVFPVPHISPPNASSPGSYEFTTEVRDADGLHASGSLEVSLLEAESGIQRYTVPVTFLDDKTYTTDDGSDKLRIDATVSGRGVDPESPLVLHYGATEHPSHLSASGYPHEAFRAMEIEFLAGQECADLLLQQQSCKELAEKGKKTNQDEPDGNGTGEPDPEETTGGENQTAPEAQATPGPAVLPWVVGVLLVQLLLHRARSDQRRPDAD